MSYCSSAPYPNKLARTACCRGSVNSSGEFSSRRKYVSRFSGRTTPLKPRAAARRTSGSGSLRASSTNGSFSRDLRAPSKANAAVFPAVEVWGYTFKTDCTTSPPEASKHSRARSVLRESGLMSIPARICGLCSPGVFKMARAEAEATSKSS